MLNTAVQNHFNALRKQGGKFKRQTKHRQSLVTLSRRSDLIKFKIIFGSIIREAHSLL